MATDLEPRKYAALDEAIYCRRVHTQYLGNLADGKNSLDFVLPRPGLFHQSTTSDIATRITKLSAVISVAHHGRKTTTPSPLLFRRFLTTMACAVTCNADTAVNLTLNRIQIDSTDRADGTDRGRLPV
jgi:hypothetical protein